ncbi:cobyrinate a,c-diamide synthase [Beijerinckia sp. L45]|uniref:cobyrinate a,c-diamide synthase n=1 Tax=Beijerinckia sp. L45 TaxID=1641855 RepID=UPI00131E9367|nr:cobyrinate a,c-diamide synthase [Beijerinckia sp. L45]
MTEGLLISAPRSGSGKTVLTLGLMRAFARRGLRVAGAKNGPDYIDPAFHAAATGRVSLNLDTWAMGPGLIGGLASLATTDCDLLICEGSMGLFDGVAAPPRASGSSADLAATLGLPVLLVLDVSGQSQTAAAIAKGCDTLDPGVRIGGVILNRVAGDRHRRLAADAIEAIGLKVVGALPRSTTLVLPERHLGLVQAEETVGLDAMLDAIADFVAMHVDLDAVQALARPLAHATPGSDASALPPPAQRIAVARDAAFSFLYPHILQGWRAAGAEFLFFSPLADEPPPADADLCWLPGGYPELHAGRLAAAGTFRDGLRRFADKKPIHGECGGYMVLGETLIDADGVTHRMAGLLGASSSFAKRKMHLGYRDVTLEADCSLGVKSARLRGHEFHYATGFDGAIPDLPFAMAADAQGNPPAPSGTRRGLVTGSFFHVVAMRT